jgi:hypothetical protein
MDYLLIPGRSAQFNFLMNYVIEGSGALVNPSEKHQYRNKGDKPFKMASRT